MAGKRAIFIEFDALCDRIEHPEIRRRIGPTSGNPLPRRAVICMVGIGKTIPEPRLAMVPMKAQIFD